MERRTPLTKHLGILTLFAESWQLTRGMKTKFWLYFAVMACLMGGMILSTAHTNAILFTPNIATNPLEFFAVSRLAELLVDLSAAPFVAAVFAITIAANIRQPLSTIKLGSFFKPHTLKNLFGYRITTLLITLAVGIFFGFAIGLYTVGFNDLLITFTIEFIEGSNLMNFISIAIELLFIVTTPLITHEKLPFAQAMEKSFLIMMKNFVPALGSLFLMSMVIILSAIPLAIDFLNVNGLINLFESNIVDVVLKFGGLSLVMMAMLWLLPMSFIVLSRVYLREARLARAAGLHEH